MSTINQLVAVPTNTEQCVDDHFGHCQFYTIFSIDSERKICGSSVFPSPQGCGCKSDIASVLKAKGVTVMLAGNMGQGALNVLTKYGIEVARGCFGSVSDVIDSYLQGKIKDSGEGCTQHDDAHECNHTD